MSDVIILAEKRFPVTFTVTVTSYWDGTVEYYVEGVSDDPRSQQSVTDAMRRYGGFQDAADVLNRALLDRINSLMGAQPGSDDAAELARLAEIVQRYEAVRYPLKGATP